jgi:HEPN domain-containing protein
MSPHEEWIFKAERDLECAKYILQINLDDVSAYHAQQCAEKAFKGFLSYNNIIIPKIHKLDMLCLDCQALENSFSSIYNNAINLNGLDVRFRYPSAVLIPNRSDVLNAINDAEIILDFVKSKCI